MSMRRKSDEKQAELPLGVGAEAKKAHERIGAVLESTENRVTIDYPNLGTDHSVQMLEEAKKIAKEECGFEIDKATDAQIRENRPKILYAFSQKGFEAHYDEGKKRLTVSVDRDDSGEYHSDYRKRSA